MNLRPHIEKLQNLPEHKKKIILWTVVVILGLVMGVFWFQGFIKTLSNIGGQMQNIKIPQINTSGMPSLNILQTTTPGNENVVVQNADWKTYTNSKYGFEIKYPLDWTFREYISGAAFFPKNKSGENTTGNGSVNIGFYERGANYCKIPFEDYVKIAGPSEIQNYESLNTIEIAENDNGIEVYKTTWNYADFQGNKKVSLPIAYFKTENQQSCGSVEAFLNDNNYSDIYDSIISTFKFTN